MTNRNQRLAALAVIVIGACAITLGAWSLTSGQGNERPRLPVAGDPDVDQPPRGGFQFLSPNTGKFFVGNYDDRELSDEARAKDPVYNPAWKPFSACLTSEGFPSTIDASVRFSQADLDRVLARVNADNPDPAANLNLLRKDEAARSAVAGSDPKARSAAAFLNCAERWLTKSAKEVFEATGEPNEYYSGK